MADQERTFTEEIQLAGTKVVGRVKELLAEGQVRRLRLKGAHGEPIVEIPLNVGALGAGAMAVAAPWLALVAAFAGLVGHVTLEIVRAEPEGAAKAVTAAATKPAKAAKPAKTAKAPKTAKASAPPARKAAKLVKAKARAPARRK